MSHRWFCVVLCVTQHCDCRRFCNCKCCVRVSNCPQGTLSIRMQRYSAQELNASLENSCALSRNICGVFLIKTSTSYMCVVVWVTKHLGNVYYFLMLLEVTMPRSRNGEATARDTLLAIQERRKNKNNAETSGKQKTPPSSPGINKKKQPTPTKNKKTTPQTSPAAKEGTSLTSSASTPIMCSILYRVFCFTTPIT